MRLTVAVWLTVAVRRVPRLRFMIPLASASLGAASESDNAPDQ